MKKQILYTEKEVLEIVDHAVKTMLKETSQFADVIMNDLGIPKEKFSKLWDALNYSKIVPHGGFYDIVSRPLEKLFSSKIKIPVEVRMTYFPKNKSFKVRSNGKTLYIYLSPSGKMKISPRVFTQQIT